MKIGQLVESSGGWPAVAGGNVGIITERWIGELGYYNYIVEFLVAGVAKAYYSNSSGSAVSTDGEYLSASLGEDTAS